MRQAVVLGDPGRHVALSRAMARAIGVDLSDRMAEGRLDAGRFADLITRCRGQGCGDRCAAWLAAQTQTASCPPPFCANTAALTALQPKAERPSENR